MNRLLFLSLLMVGFFFKGVSQKYFERKQVVPSAPNTAAIEKFIDYPVSLYTGVPDIGIPLYSIKLKSITVPISVSYHAAGVRVDDIASNVGMGWNLTAGGVVSIHANGIMDETSGYGYQYIHYNKVKNFTFQTFYAGGTFPCSVISSSEDLRYLYSGGDIDYFRNIQNQIDDSEPDIYSYSFNGRSGKFFQDETGVFRTIPFSKVKIQRLFSGSIISGYEITDTDGTRYQFQKMEETTVNSNNICTPNEPATTVYGRSYYLTKIITLFNEEVNFHYSSSFFQYYLQGQFSRSLYLDPGCSPLNVNGGYASNCVTNSNMLVGSWKIDSITATDGSRILFGYSAQDRTDLQGTKSLKEVVIRKTNSEEDINKYEFTYDYWVSRLRLKTLKENGKPPYQFQYNGTPGEPRLSFSQDHWGYFNGFGNSTLLPKNEYIGFNTGANRNPNPYYVEAGILNKITYPTGGYVEYYYEPNEYFEPLTTTVHHKVNGALLTSLPDQTVTTEFVVPSYSSGHYLILNNTYDGTVLFNDYCFVRLYGPNGFLQQFVGSDLHKEVNLLPGAYTLEIENVGSQYAADATVVWFNTLSVPPHNEIGGGVRVKEIKAYDGLSTSVYTKKFEYNQPGTTISSGKSMYRPSYEETRAETVYTPAVGCASNTGALSCMLLTQSSNSLAPLGFSGGYQVGYTDVTVYTKSKEENGYSEFKHIIENSNSIGLGIPSVPYAPIVNYDWVNGTLVEQVDKSYNGVSYDPVRKVKRYFNYDAFDKDSPGPNTYTTYGAKIMMIAGPHVSGRCNFGCIDDVLSNIQFGIQRFQLFSSWHYLIKEEETIYQTPTTSSTITTDYVYDNLNHIQPTKIIKQNSKGEKNSILIKYPLDYVGLTSNDPISNGVKSLITWNIQSAEVEKTLTVSNANGSNARFLNSQFNIYSSIFPVVNSIKGIETSTPLLSFNYSAVSGGAVTIDSRYKDQGLFNYSSSGNVIETQKINDVKSSYIWGYNNQYPIAEVVNSKSSEIFHDNFEELSGWDASLTAYDGSNKKTGKYSGKIDKPTSGELTSHSTKWLTISLTAPKTFKYSTWVYSTGPTAEIFLFMKRANESGYFSYVTSVQSTEINKWVLIVGEYNVPSDVTQLGIRLDNNGGGTVWFDDVRLHPSDAMMTTYTYKPLVGMTSHTDANNRNVYYEYDVLNRLSVVRDNDGKILKKVCYNYAGQIDNCGTSPSWQLTGNTRCKPCPSNNFYSSNILQNEQKDMNTNSPTFNQIQWVDAGTSSGCGLAVYDNEGSPYCELNGSGQNTGNQLQLRRDKNPCSNTYNQTQVVLVGYNPTACPLPQTCSWSNCNGEGYRCVYGSCEQGYRVYTDSYYDYGTGMTVCVYHYEWSDGTWSHDYYEYNYGGVFCPIMGF